MNKRYRTRVILDNHEIAVLDNNKVIAPQQYTGEAEEILAEIERLRYMGYKDKQIC